MSGEKPELKLGRRYPRYPPNVPERSSEKRFATALTILQTTGRDIVAGIDQRVNYTTGRPRQLPVATLLAAGMATATSGLLEPRKMTELMLGLGWQQQQDAGIRTTTNGRVTLVTEAKLRWLFDRISKAYIGQPHNHPIIEDDHIVNADTGEVLTALADLTADERDECECGADCPAAITIEWVANDLLAVVWDHFGVPMADTWATDSYLITTHYRPWSWGGMGNLDPSEPTDTITATKPKKAGNQGKKARGGKRIPKYVKATGIAMFNEWALNNAEHVHTSRGPHGPTAPGENFTRADKRYPQIGPDGRLIHTIDAEARAGYQGGGSVKRTAIHNGRDKHTLIASGHFPDGTAFPALPRSYVLRPGNNDKPQAAIDLIDHARRCNATITYNSVDLGYLNEDPHVLTLPAALRGVQLVSEHRKVHHRQRLYAPGVLDIDGGFFTTGTPTALQTLPQHTRDMTHKQHVALARRYDTRTAYMFRPNGTTATGRKRFRGPALPDRLTRNDAGTVTATPGVKVACPNARYYHLAPKDAPETTCTPGEACGCSTTFSAAPADIPAIHQTPAYGTTAWQRSYGRRNLAESFNARDQYHRRVGKHSIKVLPPRYNFAHALLTIGLLIDAIYSFVMRLGARDIDTQHWDHLDPHVTKACFKQLLTPEPKPHAKKRTKQDTS